MIPAISTMVPCQRNTEDTSLGENPIDLRIAISRVFSITIIANTLNMPNPDSKRIQETVIAEEIRKALNTSNQTFSLSCQLTVLCPIDS